MDYQQIIISIFSSDFGLGLGDYMRGLIFLYQNANNKIIYADYSEHPISNFLINKYHNYNISKKNKKITRIWTEKDIEELDEKYNLVYCNSESLLPFTPNLQTFIKKSFAMKKDFKKYFNKIYNSLDLSNNFVILHIRLDDMYFDTDEFPTFDILDDKIINMIIPLHGLNVIVMSNSSKLKQIIVDRYNFKEFIIKPIHTNYNYSTDELRDTLVEFFIISNSIKIYQFSQYHHASGFSKRISEIYNIEFEKFYLE